MNIATLVALVMQCWLCLLPHRASAVVLDGPTNVEVAAGEWAEFTCEVACSHTIDWFVQDFYHDITYSCMPMEGMMVCREVLRNCSSGNGFLERLRILPDHTHAASSLTIQCAATAINFQRGNCPPNLVFSRFALLKVDPLPTTLPPTPPLTTPTTNPPTNPPEVPVVPSPSPCPKPVTGKNVFVVLTCMCVRVCMCVYMWSPMEWKLWMDSQELARLKLAPLYNGHLHFRSHDYELSS